MTRPTIVDTFMFNNELDILQMRLEELYNAVDHFVLVEAKVDHQDHPKPLHYAENRERFKPWADKIVHVIAGDMPTKAQDNDPWAREHAQREFIADGVARLGLVGSDIILESDVDEIPRALHTRNVRPNGKIWAFGQRGHFWAVDWLYSAPWYGTTCTTVDTLARMAKVPGARPFAYLRDVRITAECPAHLQDAGWHFSWLGGAEAALKKVGSFCHPEVEQQIRDGLTSDQFLRQGVHVDGVKMHPVEVNEEWPAFIRERRCPADWFRPR
jgi:hypothetical protein